MRAGRGRTILVVEEQPYLWAFLQERIERATAYVRGATPGQVADVWRACVPWPWIVVGATRTLPAGLAELLDGRPIPVHWLGEPPPRLPGAPTVHTSWRRLTDDLQALNHLSLNGVRLLRNRGLLAPGGVVAVDVAAIEGLLAAPAGLRVPLDPGDVRRALRTNRLPLDVEREDGVLRLTAAPA